MGHELAAFLAAVDVAAAGAGAGRWVGRPDHPGEVLFGGFVLAQAVRAATKAAPEGRRLHSFHAYFLRPVIGGTPIDYAVDVVRDGRSFASRHLTAAQDGKPVLDALCSFTTDTDGRPYDLPAVEPVPRVSELEVAGGPGPWVCAWIGPSALRDDGTRESTDRKWLRIEPPLPDDVGLHAALLAFASDWTGRGGRPYDLGGDPAGMVSLDHAIWFHRPARADEWLFYDVQSLVNAGGRSLLRGVMRDEAGHVVVSVSQEMLLR